jgi:hypothetical protein
MRRMVALALIAVVMAACSSNELAEQGDRSRAGDKNKQPQAVAGSDGGKSNSKQGSRDAAGSKNDIEDAQDAIGEQGGGSGGEAPADFGGADAPSSGIDPSLARASGEVADPATDAKSQGLNPRYTEITGASVQGLGKNVLFTVTFGGSVPETFPKEEYMVVALGITGRSDDDGFSVGAVANDKGWETYGGTRGENGKLPGRFDISGNEMTFEVPWSFVKGPRAFEWYASSGWYGQVANQTHWSFDGAPNDRAAEFPG